MFDCVRVAYEILGRLLVQMSAWMWTAFAGELNYGIFLYLQRLPLSWCNSPCLPCETIYWYLWQISRVRSVRVRSGCNTGLLPSSSRFVKPVFQHWARQAQNRIDRKKWMCGHSCNPVLRQDLTLADLTRDICCTSSSSMPFFVPHIVEGILC